MDFYYGLNGSLSEIVCGCWMDVLAHGNGAVDLISISWSVATLHYCSNLMLPASIQLLHHAILQLIVLCRGLLHTAAAGKSVKPSLQCGSHTS